MAIPQCKYFGTCGGCTSQHVEYSLQLENKKKNLQRATKLDNVSVYNSNEYNYRTRMDLMFSKNGLGFRKKGQWKEIVDIEECKISNQELNKFIAEVREFFKEPDYFDPGRNSGTLRYAVIRTPPGDSSISFVLNSDSTKIEEAIEKIKEYSEKTTVNNIVIAYVQSNTDMSLSDDYVIIKGTDKLKEGYLGKEFSYPIQGFFQNNHEMAEKMQEYCNKILRDYETQNSQLLDLYGGVGTFGVMNAELFKNVLIVENNKQSIDLALDNIKNNNIKNAEAMVLDARYIKRLKLNENLYVITDPPRSGMHPDTIIHLRKIKPKAIIYISCNVEQLAKDLVKFKEYKIVSAALFDLFPQTNHSEAIVEMKLK